MTSGSPFNIHDHFRPLTFRLQTNNLGPPCCNALNHCLYSSVTALSLNVSRQHNGFSLHSKFHKTSPETTILQVKSGSTALSYCFPFLSSARPNEFLFFSSPFILKHFLIRFHE